MSRTYRRKNERLGFYAWDWVWMETTNGESYLSRMALQGAELKKQEILFHMDGRLRGELPRYIRNIHQRKNRRMTKKEIHQNLIMDSFDEYCTSDVEDLSWWI